MNKRKTCDCCVEYDENRQRIDHLCEFHRQEEEERLRKEYNQIEELKKREFVFRFHFVGWWAFSFGFHIDIISPNIEIHLPFGFIKIGLEKPSKII